jgi:hypothetical protein
LETSLKIATENASINRTGLWLLLARAEGNERIAEQSRERPLAWQSMYLLIQLTNSP